MGTKRKLIENLVQIPDEGSGPVWMDAVNNGYPEVRDTFMHMLRTIFPTVARMEHKLPPVQRRAASVRCIPDINQFYPTGVMAPYVQMTPEQQKAVNAAYIEIGRAIRQAYSEGNENGRNLLVGLAKGEVTISDFNAGATIPKPEDED